MQISIYNFKASKNDLFNNVSKMYPNEYFSYKKFKKKDLLDLVVDFYENYRNILSICTLNEFLLLKKIYENESYKLTRDDNTIVAYNLEHKYLIARGANKQWCVITELCEFVKKAISHFDEKTMKNNDKICKIAATFLILFPLDNVFDFAMRIHDVIRIDEVKIFKFLISNYCFLYKVHLVYDRLDNIYFVTDGVYPYYKEILKERENNKKFNVGIYTKVALNSRLTSLLKCSVLNRVDDVMDEAMYYIVHCVNLNMQIDETIKYVKENVSDFDENKYRDLLVDVFNNFPSCSLYGLTLNEYNACLEKSKTK